MFRECLKMSWKNITNNKMQSFLTTLGIVIGVAATISLVTVMEGAIQESRNQFEGLGAGKLSVSIPGTPIKQGITNKEMQEMLEIDNVKSVTPNVSTKMSIIADREVIEDISIEGKNDIYFESNKDAIIKGRGLNLLDITSKNNVCVINKDLEEKAFLGKNSINKKITINGISYTIVGVIDFEMDDPMAMMTMMGASNNGTVMLPYQQAMKIADIKNITSLEITVLDTSKTGSTESYIEGFLNQKFNDDEDAFTIINMESILDVMTTMQNMMKGILVGIASISLLVGGVGIMNIMVVSVVRRTTEIGLLKSLGARPKDIQLLFLIEATTLSVLGGVIGAILGISLSLIGFSLLNIPAVISPGAIALGVGFSALIGIIFGWSPAKKASELNPIDALRSV